MPALTAAFDESCRACARVSRRHAVQVAPACRGVVTSPQFSDFSPINARRGEAFVW
jgi:hypothetical protein